jgi:hypothetical protein
MKTAEQTTPEIIYLLLDADGEGYHLWCADPNPAGDEESRSVEYVRSDVSDAILNLQKEMLKNALSLLSERSDLIHQLGEALLKAVHDPENVSIEDVVKAMEDYSEWLRGKSQ